MLAVTLLPIHCDNSPSVLSFVGRSDRLYVHGTKQLSDSCGYQLHDRLLLRHWSMTQMTPGAGSAAEQSGMS
eukprot:5191349-Amphidinium_carterae.2